MPFYKKQDNELQTAEFIDGPGYTLTEATHLEYTYPVDGWYWFADLDSALTGMANTTSHLTILQFLQRFTQTERVNIRAAAGSNAALDDYLYMLQAATYVDLSRADTQAGVRLLETVGLIASGRADQILAV